jgi:hypothetical protein
LHTAIGWLVDEKSDREDWYKVRYGNEDRRGEV